MFILYVINNFSFCVIKKMALYDNKHWLLSAIRNSFISSDDTGMCEVVMTGENLCKTLSDTYKYPGVEDSDDDDLESLEDHADLEFGLRRQRSNTAIRLEKMDRERKEAANITLIKWKTPRPFSELSEEERYEMFSGVPVESESNDRSRKKSLLTQQLRKFSILPLNPFQEFGRFDGSSQIGAPTRKYGIFLTMLKPEHSGYPMFVNVIISARVFEFIGLILWKCSLEYPQYKLKDNVSFYELRLAEDDGEVDWVLSSLDPKEPISKFILKMLALVEKSQDSIDSDRKQNTRNQLKFPFSSIPLDNCRIIENPLTVPSSEENSHAEDPVRALEAMLYQSFKVLMCHKVRTKTEINLGVSHEKIDMDPVLKSATKFLTKRKPTSLNMNYVVACDLIETKSSNRAVFRLVYDSSIQPELTSSLQKEYTSWSDFKHHDFECEHRVAEDIVQKVNHILDVIGSNRRKEYLQMRERRSHRRKSFHFGPR